MWGIRVKISVGIIKKSSNKNSSNNSSKNSSSKNAGPNSPTWPASLNNINNIKNRARPPGLYNLPVVVVVVVIVDVVKWY